MGKLTPEQLLLAEAMSELSENAYCAGWMDGLEYDLWNILSGAPQRYGRIEVTGSDVARLKALSAKCGGWIVFDDEHAETFVPLPRWQEIYGTYVRTGDRPT